jgi:hypothetical protein
MGHDQVVPVTDVHDLEIEILRISAAIDSLCEAKETMEAFGVPFTALQMKMLDWYLERKQDLERLIPEPDEIYDDDNPEHSKVTHDETLWDSDLIDAMLKRKDGKLH